MGPDTQPQGRHDAALGEIMEQEGNDVRGFLNAVFGFLSRRCPEEVFGSGGGGSGGGGGHIAGQHLVSQSFCRWRQQYQEQRAEEELQKVMLREREGVPEAVVEEVVSTSNHTEGAEEGSTSGSSPLHSTSPGHPSSPHRQGGTGTKAGSCGYLDTTNGAVLDGLAWTQSIDDLEVQVVVPSGVTRGKQVRVAVKQSSLAVSVQDGGGSAWHTLLDGTLAHPVRAEECLWSLVSGEHVAIHLEKSEERWWNRLLTQHDPIDLQKISAEREYGSLPEEDRSKIQELMWSRWQKDQGKPTSDQLRMESVLREAWTAEGSPFQGRPFDPSSVTLVGGQGFSAT